MIDRTADTQEKRIEMIKLMGQIYGGKVRMGLIPMEHAKACIEVDARGMTTNMRDCLQLIAQAQEQLQIHADPKIAVFPLKKVARRWTPPVFDGPRAA